MLPDATLADYGQPFASGTLPTSHWAYYGCCDNADADARDALEELTEFGAAEDAYYQILGPSNLPDHHVELELVRFGNEEGALGWYTPTWQNGGDTDVDTAADTAVELSTDATGGHSSFTAVPGWADYVFVKGPYVADVYCTMEGEDAGDCETVTRALAEPWYAHMPG